MIKRTALHRSSLTTSAWCSGVRHSAMRTRSLRRWVTREMARRLSRVPHPYGPADAAFFLDQIVPYEWTWAITMLGGETLIGTIGLTPDTTELGN
ncbi:hypothetical protein ACH0BU_16985 [Sphingomonas olei]